MKIVLSPAKKLELKKDFPDLSYQKPAFVSQAEQLVQVMKEKSPAEIKKMMKLSDNLAEMNWERYQNWKKEIDASARPAIFSFDGAVFKGIDAWSLSKEQLIKLNQNVRILSGLYGILRPFDLIYPYRLEMGSRLAFDAYKNLYDYWSDGLTNHLQNEMKPGEVLVNLASQEYFKVIDKQKLNHPVIDIEFKEYKNGQLKTITIYTKTARGRMARFITVNNIVNPDELKLFDWDGYAFDANLSKANQLVFTR